MIIIGLGNPRPDYIDLQLMTLGSHNAFRVVILSPYCKQSFPYNKSMDDGALPYLHFYVRGLSHIAPYLQQVEATYKPS